MGSLKFHGFSLGGATGSLLAGILIGAFIKVPVVGMAKSVLFLLFMFGIGYSIGPKFFKAMKEDGWRFGVIGVFVPVIGLLTSEGGLEDTFTVKLQVKPMSNVTIGLSSSDLTEGMVLPPLTLTFTPLNWNTAQTVTVKGVDDSIADNSKVYLIITAPAVSGDPDYSGVNPADVSATNSDNETAGVTVAPSPRPCSGCAISGSGL